VDANGLLNASRAISYVAGPSAGGALVQALTAPVALVADALTYLASAALLIRMRVAEPPPRPESAVRGMAAGIRLVAGSPVLRPLLLGTTTLNLFNYVFAALFILYVTTVLHISPGALGVVIGIGALGGLLSAAVTGRLSRRIGIGPALLLGLALFAGPLILVPAAGGGRPAVYALLVVSEFVAAFGVVLLDIAAGSLQTAATPPTMLAVVSGVNRTVNYGIRPVGALLGGALGTAIGLRPALWIATVGGLLGLLPILLSPLRTMRTLPEPHSEGQPTPAV
jgi:predicted MFS family arabinose efflux permease